MTQTGPPVLGVAAGSEKINKESVKKSKKNQNFLDGVARIKGCFAP